MGNTRVVLIHPRVKSQFLAPRQSICKVGSVKNLSLNREVWSLSIGDTPDEIG